MGTAMSQGYLTDEKTWLCWPNFPRKKPSAETRRRKLNQTVGLLILEVRISAKKLTDGQREITTFADILRVHSVGSPRPRKGAEIAQRDTARTKGLSGEKFRGGMNAIEFGSHSNSHIERYLAFEI